MEKLAAKQDHDERQQGSWVPPYCWVACPPSHPPTTSRDPRIEPAGGPAF